MVALIAVVIIAAVTLLGNNACTKSTALQTPLVAPALGRKQHG